MTMKPRTRVLTTLRRQVPDRVPKTFSLSPAQLERFRIETGAEDPAEYFDFEMRHAPTHYSGAPGPPSRSAADFEQYYDELPARAEIDEWGIAWLPGSFYHFRDFIPPLRNANTVEEIAAYPYPDLTAEGRFEGYADEVQRLQDAGYAVVGSVSPVGGTVFWPAYKLRGMETLLVDMCIHPELAAVLMDKVTEISVTLARKVTSLGVDILWLADDFGTQQDLIVGPPMWQAWFKPRLRRVIASAKQVNPDIIVAFHSDGNVEKIVPDLIDIGVEVLNPVQPECMDPAKLKADYGEQLAFWGAIGTQTTLPFGTPQEVKAVVKERIETVGVNGGFVIAPTHVVEPEVPWENILAFVEAVEEYGVY